MFQSRLTLFVLLLFFISCKDENKVEFVETNKIKTNTSVSQQISADNSPAKQLIQRKKPGNKPGKIKKIKTDKPDNTDYSQLFEKKAQTFIVDQKNDTTLTCSEGTVIKISQRSFVFDDDNSEPGEVIINVREYYKIDDIIFANLTTRSGDSILETGGMIYIEAVSKERKCKLKEDSRFEISFPYETRKENMQLFAGSWKNGTIDWITEELDSSCYLPISVIAEFPGGNNKYMQFLYNNLKYPDSLAENCINGKVSVRFEIDETGKARFINIIEPRQQAFNVIMRDLFHKMPRWKPTIQNGKPIRSRMIQPVIFFCEDESFDTSYNREFEEQINDTLINEITIAEISKYVFSSSKLGWINCDRFYNDRKPRTDLYVKTAAYPDADVKIIFHSFKGILQGEKTLSGYVLRF